MRPRDILTNRSASSHNLTGLAPYAMVHVTLAVVNLADLISITEQMTVTPTFNLVPRYHQNLTDIVLKSDESLTLHLDWFFDDPEDGTNLTFTFECICHKITVSISNKTLSWTPLNTADRLEKL